MIDITELDKVEVLRVLYAHARPLGLGVLQYTPGPLSREEATKLLQQSYYFDYLKGRVMKVNLSNSFLDTRLYNRDNGPGAAEAAIASLK